MKSRIYFVLLVVAVFSLMAAGVNANIYMDEDFEGTAAFANQGYPVYPTPVDTTPAEGFVPEIDAKGINIRAYDNDAARISPLLTVTGNGTMVTSRRFLGSKSYQLQAGQSLQSSTSFPEANMQHIRFHQFAVSVDADAASEAPGTVIGRFTNNYSLDTNLAVANESIIVELVVSSTPGTIDLMAKTLTWSTGQKIGSFWAGMGNWGLVSIININRHATATDQSAEWNAFDPITQTFKGPLTGNENLATPYEKTNRHDLARGVYFFVNSTNLAQAVNFEPGNQLPTSWGSDGANPSVDVGHEMGFVWQAVNGTIYLDNLHWNHGIIHNAQWKIAQEASARLLDFDVATTEPMGASVGESWLLY